MSLSGLHAEISQCRICADNLPFGLHPVVQFSATSQLLIIGQAPGSRVHESGIPWDDMSGARLLEWTGLTRDQLYDSSQVALVPMGFCYPGKGKSGDNPPRPECAPQWHARILAGLPENRLTLLVGTYAQAYYLPQTRKFSLTERVRNCRDYLPQYLPLPHPSWRSSIWMTKNPWFAVEVLPVLRRKIADQLIR